MAWIIVRDDLSGSGNFEDQDRRQKKMSELAVMETAEWYTNDQITSIKDMFHILAQRELQNPNGFLYSSFVNTISFNATLEYFRDTNTHRIRYVYIGCHGSGWLDDQLETPAGDTISRTQIFNRINRKRIRGVFLSSCNSDGIAKYVAGNAPYNIWVAGYGEEVDWIQSSAFEMLFWQKVFLAEEHGLGKAATLDLVVDGVQTYESLRA